MKLLDVKLTDVKFINVKLLDLKLVDSVTYRMKAFIGQSYNKHYILINYEASIILGFLGSISAGGLFGLSPGHHRMSSLDSTTSDESSIPTPHNCFGSVSSLISGQNNLKDHYGSITSLASSTSLISPQVPMETVV